MHRNAVHRKEPIQPRIHRRQNCFFFLEERVRLASCFAVAVDFVELLVLVHRGLLETFEANDLTSVNRGGLCLATIAI